MEPLQILYIMMGAVGVFFLALSIFGGDADGVDLDIDGDFDISDVEAGVDSPSVFSMKFIATFLLAFGIAGVVVSYNGGGVGAQLGWGAGIGLAVSALYFFIMKFMYSMQGSSIVDAESLIGKTAIVSIPTTSSGKGQIRISTNTGSTEYSCIEQNSKKLKQNQTVKVVSVVDAGTLLVKTSK